VRISVDESSTNFLTLNCPDSLKVIHYKIKKNLRTLKYLTFHKYANQSSNNTNKKIKRYKIEFFFDWLKY
jgi:hypothetical protein